MAHIMDMTANRQKLDQMLAEIATPCYQFCRRATRAGHAPNILILLDTHTDPSSGHLMYGQHQDENGDSTNLSTDVANVSPPVAQYVQT